MPEKNDKNKPVTTIRLGPVKATVWPNKTEYGTRFNVTFARLYKEKGEWHDSQSFGRDELLELAKVADQAHSWIREHERHESGEESRGDKQ